MKYGIQCHTGGWFLVCHGKEGLQLISYSSGADDGVRLLTFEGKEEAQCEMPEVEKRVGITGKYEVIPLQVTKRC